MGIDRVIFDAGVELRDRIQKWFEDESHFELHLPASADSADVVAWAREQGYLAQQVGGEIVVKKASRLPRWS